MPVWFVVRSICRSVGARYVRFAVVRFGARSVFVVRSVRCSVGSSFLVRCPFGFAARSARRLFDVLSLRCAARSVRCSFGSLSVRFAVNSARHHCALQYARFAVRSLRLHRCLHGCLQFLNGEGIALTCITANLDIDKYSYDDPLSTVRKRCAPPVKRKNKKYLKRAF